MTDLSPAAQAVRRAAASAYWAEEYEVASPDVIAAAALRAAVDQVLPDEPQPTPGGVQPGGTRMYFHERMARWEERQDARRELLNIAAELKGKDNDC